MREQFMTVQVNGRMVTGITSDGRFVRHRWRGPLPAVGALVSEPAPSRGSHGIRALALAATALVLVLVLQLPFLTPFAQASTVVTVDINPSFELTVAPSGRVVGIKALNDDAKPVVASLSSLPPGLPEMLAAVLDATAAAGKLAAGSDNLVLIGVTPGWRGMPAGVDLQALEQSVAADLDRLNIDGLVHVAGTRAVDLARARLNKLSVNRYLLARQLQGQGQNVTLDEARGKSASQLLKDHGVTPDEAVPGQRGGPHKHGNGGQSPTGRDSGNGGGSTGTQGGSNDSGNNGRPTDPGNGNGSGKDAGTKGSASSDDARGNQDPGKGSGR